MTHRRAFTLIELMIVIAIIGVLAGVLYPVMAGARKRSRTSVCVSNIHQCGVALKLYMDDYETNIPPSDQIARELLKKMLTCCPNDTEWTKGCTQTFGAPLIGSYAYTRSVPGIDRLSEKVLSGFYSPEHNNIWMADVFHSSHGIPAPYHAERERKDRYGDVHGERTFMPDNIIRLYSDGHVDTSRRTVIQTGVGSINIGFTWSVTMALPSCMSSEDDCTSEREKKYGLYNVTQ